jgi:hypothetical protein
MSAQSGLRSALAALAAVCVIAGCGSRPAYWDSPVTITTTVGLPSGVALVDDTDHRLVVLTADADLNLTARSYPIGHNVATTATSADGSTLFVLSAGDTNPTNAQDGPSLTTIQVDPTTSKVTPQQYAMSQPCTSLAVDPLGHWAVAYAQTGFVQNQNELVIFDLTLSPASATGANPNPITHTLQSFGGTPQQLTFTPPLLVDPALGVAVPGGSVNGDRRLLVIETQIDVSLLDLDHAFDNPPRPEFTIPLTPEASTQSTTPAGVAIDGFDATDSADAVLAVRTSNDTNVYIVSFGPPGPTDKNDFSPVVSQTPVGGIVSDMAFVHANGSLRLAVLIPQLTAALLVDPSPAGSGVIPPTVSLPQPYSTLSLVTPAAAAGASSSDVALLWNGGNTTGVALWTLGQALTQSYFSIDVPGVSVPIQTVSDVPNSSSLMVLEPSNGSGFFVLNLQSDEVAPLTATTTPTLSIAPDGGRVWAFVPGETELAMIDFSTLNPIPLNDTAPIDAAYDIAIAGASPARALVALHLEGSVGATVFNALTPNTTPPRRTSSLLLEAP